MSTNIFEPNKVTVALKGLMLLFTKNPAECTIGLLTQTPPVHNLRILVTERDKLGPFHNTANGQFHDQDAAGRFRLDVQNTSVSGITKRDYRIVDRQNEPDNQSAGWLVDFNRDFSLVPPIDPKPNAFISLVKVNNGQIFTTQVSDNKLEFRTVSTNFAPFGRVAVAAGIDINLDLPSSTAVFAKEHGPSIPLQLGKQYQIHIERSDTVFHAGIVDADYYFTALQTGYTAGQPVFFRSVPPLPVSAHGTPPSTPDATCPVTELSQTDPP